MMVQFGDTIYLKAETKREEDEEGFILYVCNVYKVYTYILHILYMCVRVYVVNYINTIPVD